jgi:hypothetical protein
MRSAAAKGNRSAPSLNSRLMRRQLHKFDPDHRKRAGFPAFAVSTNSVEAF